MSALPRSTDEVQARILALQDGLPKRLRQCADYVLAHRDLVAVSTVADLAAGAGVPPSAMMRFCQLLGFSGFSQMQRLYRGAFSQKWPDYRTRLENLKSGGVGTPKALLAEFVEAGRVSLETLATSVDDDALAAGVDVLAGAQTLHIIGLRRAFPVASYLAYALEKMACPAVLHDGTGKLDHRHAMRAGDALIAISFAPYSEETLDLARFARAGGLPVVALTDHAAGALAGLSSVVLTLDEVDFGAFRSLSATLALAITLAVAVGAARE